MVTMACHTLTPERLLSIAREHWPRLNSRCSSNPLREKISVDQDLPLELRSSFVHLAVTFIVGVATRQSTPPVTAESSLGISTYTYRHVDEAHKAPMAECL